MRSKLLTLMLAAVLLITVLPPANAADNLDLNDSQKIEVTTSLLGDLMDLISQEYMYDISIEQLYEAAVRGMIGELDEYSEYFSVDDYSFFMDDIMAQSYGIGVYISNPSDGVTAIDTVIPGEPADIAGILYGDIVIAVNGIDVSGMVATQVSSLIKDSYRDMVTLDIERDGRLLTFEIGKTMITRITAWAVKFEDVIESARGKDNSKYGYIVIEQISDSTTLELKRIIADYTDTGVTGIVLDFRGNSGGQVSSAIDICKLLVPKGPILFTANKSGRNITYSSDLEETPFEKMIVLVDRNTASAAEIIVAALQDAEAASIVGEKTYGKGVMQSLIPMELGDAVKFTTAEYYRRSGARVHGVGVKPNVFIETPETPTGIDDALEAAYKLLGE